MNRKFRKIIFFVLIISITISILGMSLTAIAANNTFVATTGVNMRAEPSTNARVVSVVQSGTRVDVLEHNPAGWSRVQVGSSTGFIRSDFLRFPTSDAAATFRTTEGVNVRDSGSINANVLHTVAAGTNVEVTNHDPAGWSRVRVGETNGFIRSDFLTRGNAAASTSNAGSSEAAIATLLTTGAVNMRSGSSTNTSILRTLSSNTSVEILENQSNGWSRVRHNNTNGFIRSDLLSTTGASTSQQSTTLRTTSAVNFRTGPSTNDSSIRTLAANTSVTVLENQSNGWSRVRHNNTDGFVRTDLLSATGAPATSSSGGAAIATLRTVTGVNMRSGASTGHSVIRLLPVNTSVEVLENQSNGWSRVRHNNTDGFIRSDLLSESGGSNRSVGNVELLTWAQARPLIPMRTDMRVVDVRTGISFNLRAFSLSGHADVEPPTRADTDAILRSRNGVWAWAPRPVWVTIGDRTFAAALNGMPHDVSTISGNGMNGHLCLHFAGTVTRSQSYQRNLRNAVQEAFDARPR